jgi:hypothetical protein
MGLRHFQQMWQDATETDARAMITAMNLRHSRDPVLGSGFWDTCPFDHLMVHAREIDTLYADYLTHMRELVARGRCIPMVINPLTGKAQKLHEPDVFGYDEPTLPPQQFQALMMHN